MSEETRDISGVGASAKAPLLRGKNHLFAIAIDRYLHQRPLFSCVRDSKDLIRILVSHYAFDISSVVTLFNEAATTKNILAQLDAYASTLPEEDSLVIYYAGHSVVRQGIGYWIPVDAEHFTEFLPLSSVRDFLEVMVARHVFIMVDACFAGRFFVDTRSASSLDYIEAHPSRYALTAGREERVLDGPVGGNSLFADSLKYHLVSARQAMGAVYLSDLVMRDVAEKVQGFQTPRHGELNVQGNRHGQFFFRLRAAAEQPRDLFVSAYVALGGVLIPPAQRAGRLEYFDRYNRMFQDHEEPEKAALRRMNTLAYLHVVGLDMSLLKEGLAKLGYYDGVVDQHYTEEVAEAIRRLQADQMMRLIDGYFGELTYREMVTMLVERGLATLPRAGTENDIRSSPEPDPQSHQREAKGPRMGNSIEFRESPSEQTTKAAKLPIRRPLGPANGQLDRVSRISERANHESSKVTHSQALSAARSWRCSPTSSPSCRSRHGQPYCRSRKGLRWSNLAALGAFLRRRNCSTRPSHPFAGS